MKRKETQDVEFKQSWRDEFLKEICGFANAKGGMLLVGVDDSGEGCWCRKREASDERYSK